jgi:RNA polymerase sigma factor (sigma-70 family)
MTARGEASGTIRDREDLFLAEMYPQFAEYLAEHYAAQYDVDAGHTRFMTWLGRHVAGNKAAAGTSDARSANAGRAMSDDEIVAAIAAGDPAALATAYDKYATPLYTYCRSLLREPTDAADAVQDVFVAAVSRLEGLRDPSRLRPWLYAVARQECLRRVRPNALTPVDEMPDVPDESPDPGDRIERTELRALLRAAVQGLNAAEKDMIELQLRQGLTPGEVADVLGISHNHAHALLSRARAQLEASIGALLVARTGARNCPTLSMLLEGWDGKMTVLMRKRLNRHIESCAVCAERKRRELRPAALL